MQKFALIIGFIGIIIASSDGDGFPWINWCGAIIVLLAIALYHVRKENM